MPGKQASIFSNKVFVRLLTAYGISAFGDYFDFIAMMVLIGYVWKLSPYALALLPITYAAPAILLGQFSGVLADRANKLAILIGCDLIRAVLTTLLIFAPNPWLYYPLLLLRSTASVFNFPASQALTRHVVAEAHLLKATSYNSSVFQFSKIVAPFLGGTIIAYLSPRVCLALNAVSFLLSAILLGTVVRHVHDQTSEVKTSKEQVPFLQMWREGWNILLSTRYLLMTILYYLIVMIVMQIVENQYTTLFRDIVPERVELRGWFTSSVGIGAFLTVLIFNRRNSLKKPGMMLGSGTVLVGVLYEMLGHFTAAMSSAWPLTAGFIGGIATGLSMSTFSYILQSRTPKEATGRVFGIWTTLLNTIMIVAPLSGGLLVTLYGASRTFAATGIVVLVLGAFCLLLQTIIWRDESAAN